MITNKPKHIAPSAKFITDPKPLPEYNSNHSVLQNSLHTGRSVERKETTEVIIEKTEGKKIDYSQFKKFVKKRR